MKKDNEEKLKSVSSSSNVDDKNKRGVTFGKSTTYEVDAAEDESGEYQTANLQKEGKGSPRPGQGDKKVIAEKDLSDGRSEKEKILEMLEKQQREQMEEMQEMDQWKKKIESNKPSNYDESVGESSSSNQVPLVV